MTTATKQADKRLVALLVIGVILVLTAALSLVVGCSPKSVGESATTQSDQTETSAMDGQPVNWTMESDCATCHTAEAEASSDGSHPQATSHIDQVCSSCHTEQDLLKTAHADVKFGDKPATKSTMVTVDPETCISCHGTLSEMAVKTADSTSLIDDNKVVVNPHERPAGASHEENPATCTDCHNNHSKDMNKDAMKYCAQCHHRGVFQCGTCHELRN